MQQKKTYINNLYEDKSGRLWVNNSVFDRKTGEMNTPDFMTKHLKRFAFVTVDSTGTFWTIPVDGQLWGYNPEKNAERFFNINPQSSNDGPIYADQNGLLWWGGTGVLHRFDPEKSKFKSSETTIPPA